MALSPYSAIGMLLLFKQRRITLTQAQFDEAWDTVIEVLDEVNNEKWRLEEAAEEK